MSSTSKLRICQQACLRVGLQPPETMTEDTDEALLLNETYDDIVEAYLESGLWKFAKKQAVLMRLAQVPLVKWSAVYELPADVLFIEQCWVGGARTLEYDRYAAPDAGVVLFCDFSADQEVILDYVFDAGEQYWAPTFRHVVISALCEILCTGVLEDGKRADYFANQTTKFGGRAAARDDQQQKARRFPINRFLSQRRTRSWQT